MADSLELHRYPRRLEPEERDAVLAHARLGEATPEVVRRSDDEGVLLTVLDDLMRHFRDLRDAGRWDGERSASDRWLAPRVHYALRLSRAQASDKGLWQWVALRFSWYVQWRWHATDHVVAENRWYGATHKQAFARLWWGGEAFRNGADYGPVARAFVRQDLPNSYLQHRMIRCRSLAVTILDQVAPADRELEISSDQVRDFVKTLNLITAGSPPELLAEFQADDVGNYRTWVLDIVEVPGDWDPLPLGPPCRDTSAESLSGVKVLVDRGWEFATATNR
jgi:hypothetical protein